MIFAKLRHHLPIALAALLPIAGCLLVLTTGVLGLINPRHPMKLTPGLNGVTTAVKPHLSWSSVLAGQYQREFSQVVGQRTSLYPAAVRLRNQVVYSVFGELAGPGVLVGRGQRLIERAYADDYCSRNVAAFLPPARVWAKQIRAMQDDAARRGQTFLYVLTPNKVSFDPAVLPAGWPCPAAAADRDGVVPAWLSLLRAAGVNVADTPDALRTSRADYPFALFPRGGTHWNAVGASIALNAIDTALQRLRQDGQFPPFRFTWVLSHSPHMPDNDLAFLANLMREPLDYTVPDVTPVPATPPNCRKLHVVIVGGSFTIQVADRMAISGCRPDIDLFEYWKIALLEYRDGIRRITEVDPAARDRAVLQADVLIYEENEQVLNRSNHGHALYDFLAAQPGWQR